MERFINGSNDYFFKKLLSRKEKCGRLLSLILNEEIKLESIEYDITSYKTELLAKESRLDVVINYLDKSIDIEMQKNKTSYSFYSRADYYLYQLAIKSLKQGEENYSKLKKVIGIWFTNFSINESEELIQVFELKSQEGIKDPYIKNIFINLTKKNKCDNIELKKWLTLFIGDEEDMKELIKDENKDISESAEFIFSWNKTEEEKYLAMKREETIMEQNSIRELGEIEGMKKGMEKGSQQAKIEMVKKMYEDNMPLELIVKYSGLSIEEIKSIMDE